MDKALSKSARLKFKQVVISNMVTKAAQGVNLNEKRLLMLALAKAENVAGEIKITVKDMVETFGIAESSAYDFVKNTAKSLRKKAITFADEDKGQVRQWEVNWLSHITYKNKEGQLTLTFNPYITPYLFELERHFTFYQLQQASSFKHFSSWRLMELFEQMKGRKKDGWVQVSLEDFHFALETSNTCRKNFAHLRVSVIEPAIKELTSSGWVVNWEAIREGRKVVALKFDYSHNRQIEPKS